MSRLIEKSFLVLINHSIDLSLQGVETGCVTTLGRGGSDLTATALGKALGLREIQVNEVLELGLHLIDTCHINRKFMGALPQFLPWPLLVDLILHCIDLWTGVERR